MKSNVIVFALALAACADFPQDRNRLMTDADVARSIHAGTSRAEVRDLLGAPQRMASLPRLDREVWTYKAIGIWRKELFVQFSPDGIVRETELIDDPQVNGG